VNKNKGTRCKVEITNGVFVAFLELVDGGVVAGSDVVMDCSKIGWAF